MPAAWLHRPAAELGQRTGSRGSCRPWPWQESDVIRRLRGFEQGKWSSLFPTPGTNGWLTSVGASSCPGDEGGLSEEDKARSR